MRAFLAPLVSLAALLWQPAAMGWTLTGRVVAIFSGDTIKVRDERQVEHTVRLAGIDAPEKFQQYAQRSLESLRELVFQRNVVVEIPGQDRRASRVGKVLLEGRDMNLEQLHLGAAWFNKAPVLTPEDRQAYAEAEADARVRRTGLWREAQPIPPWEYRAGRRK